MAWADHRFSDQFAEARNVFKNEVFPDAVKTQLKVYDVVLDPGVEADVQEIYFTSMELVPGQDELLIENEAGARYVVDLRSRAVRKAP